MFSTNAERCSRFYSRETFNQDPTEITPGVFKIGVEKSSHHQQSQAEIAGDNPCSRHLSDLKVRWRVYCDVAISSDWPTGFPIGSTDARTSVRWLRSRVGTTSSSTRRPAIDWRLFQPD